jgi:pentatricopeptide repeat protein
MLTHQIHHLHTLHAHINSPQPNDTKMHISQFICMHTYIINIILKDTFYAYASHGHAKQALIIFYQMRSGGCKPDDITFVDVLPACLVGLISC